MAATPDPDQVAQMERQQKTERKKQSMKNPYDMGYAPPGESEWFGVDCDNPSKGKKIYKKLTPEQIEKENKKKRNRRKWA